MAIRFICAVLVLLYLLVDLTCARKREVLNETCHAADEFLNNLRNCSTLEKVLIDHDADVQIDFKISQLQLDTKIPFTHRNTLVMNGVAEITTITCTNNSAGIVLSDISDKITINNLTFISCALEIHHKKKTYISALTIIQCNNVDLNNVIIKNGTGIGLMFLDHQGGEVNVHSSSFLNRKSRTEPQMDVASDSMHRGGGVFIKLSPQNQQSRKPMTFLFDSCTFENNSAYSIDYNSFYADIVSKSKNESIQGGGAYVFIGSGLENVNISFNGCEFVANQAYLGGGLLVKLQGKEGKRTERIKVKVSNSSFSKNVAYFGGGAELIIDGDSDVTSISASHIILENVNFTENKGNSGGAVHYYSSKQQALNDSLSLNSLLLDNCIFKSNQAHFGSAVTLAPDVFFQMSMGRRTVEPIFRNCCFTNNSVLINDNHAYGLATLYFSFYTVHFHGFILFERNNGSPIFAVDGVINLQKSDARFTNNNGLHGGAISLIGSSIMIVGPRKYEFLSNHALYRGGALYVMLNDITTSTCFIQYRDDNNNVLYREWEAVITFKGNTAKNNVSAGNTIYTTSLYACLIISEVNYDTESERVYTQVEISDVFFARGKNITFDGEAKVNSSQVTTDAAFLKRNNNSTLFVVPGNRTSHNVQAIDEFNQSVNVPFEVTLSLEQMNTNIVFEQGFVRDSILLNGKPNSEAILILHTLLPRMVHVWLPVKLTYCPPGFNLSPENKCVCRKDLQFGINNCDSDDFQSYLSPGYWMGFKSDSTTNDTSELVTSVCPFNTNNTSKDKELGSSLLQNLDGLKSTLNKITCGTAREGFACGKCSNSYTVHFNSPSFSCKPTKLFECKLGWFFYILSELVPVTFGFIFILILNISFTSGTVNGFILFSQLLLSFEITASGIIPYQSKTIQHLSQGNQILYGLLNLEFFNLEQISFCIWKRASALDILAFKYVTVLYIVVLIATVIWTMNTCGGRWVGKCCRISAVKTSVVHGISTFIVICYSQCIKVSLGLIVPLYSHTSTSSSPSTRVWFNGELEYFSKTHLLYAIPALIFLLTIGLLPPVLLLSYPLLNKALTIFGLEDIKVVKGISKYLPVSSLKPLLDSFQGCFKDNFRFFAGLYFLYRWTFLLTYVIIKDFSVYYPTVSGILTVMLTLHTICQPYTKREHNIIDTLLFANLMVINSLSYFSYQKSTSNERDVDAALAVQVVLIYLPLIVMSVYIIRASYKYVNEKRGCKCTPPLSEKSIARRVIRLRGYMSPDSNSSDEDFIHDRIMDEDVEYKEMM